jgi:hypothetical protein
MDDWYRISAKTVLSLGGSGILYHYGKSMLKGKEKLLEDHIGHSITTLQLLQEPATVL